MRWSATRGAAPSTPAAAPAVTALVSRSTAAPRARRGEQDTSMEAAARQAGVLSQASREVSDTSREAAESLAELRAAIGEISTSAGRASAVAQEAVQDAQASQTLTSKKIAAVCGCRVN